MALIGIKVRKGVLSLADEERLHHALGVAIIPVMDMGDVEPIYDESELMKKILARLESIDDKITDDGDGNIWVHVVKHES